MDIGENIANWLLGHIETLPATFLRDKNSVTARRFIDTLIGEREAAELTALLAQPAVTGDRVQTVLLPGIMGSLLSSVRGISAMLWVNPTVLLNGQINLLNLDHAGENDESVDVEITAVGIEKLFYLNLIITLAQNTRLYEFPYDWRYSNQRSARHLYSALRRWYESTHKKFVLVGHSMGGIVIRTFMALYPAEAVEWVQKVVLLASPLQGAPSTAALLAGLAPEQGLFNHMNMTNDLLSLASSFPSVYELLPPPQEYFRPQRSYPVDWDLYDAGAWQGQHVHQHHLDHAATHYQLLDRTDPQVPVTQIAGFDQLTMTDIHREEDPGSVLMPVYQKNGDQTGDDLVPLYSSCDGRYETFYINERHQYIPGNKHVRQAVLDLIHGDSPELCTTPTCSEGGLAQKLGTQPLIHQLQEITQRFERGSFTRDDLAKLFWGSQS